jgi:hypothetical protein
VRDWRDPKFRKLPSWDFELFPNSLAPLFAHVSRVSCEQRNTHYEMWELHYDQDLWNKNDYEPTALRLDVA